MDDLYKLGDFKHESCICAIAYPDYKDSTPENETGYIPYSEIPRLDCKCGHKLQHHRVLCVKSVVSTIFLKKIDSKIDQ